MANLKSLAKDTAIYGVSSIIGRFLNYLLVPLYTFKMTAETGDYGIVTNIYSYVAVLLVILTFGMETTFFRFANKENLNPLRVYSTTLYMVGGVGLLFLTFLFLFIHPIASWMQYGDHPEFVATMFLCVTIDAFQCVPFAYLRYQKRPIKFASLKILFIVMNISLNLIYFLLIPYLYEHSSTQHLVTFIYNGHIDVAFVFYINLICTLLITFFLRKELTGFKYVFDASLAKKMWHYSWPILILGIAGILNQTADKILYPFFSSFDAHTTKIELGIYGACAKIAMIMTLFTQAFRYAYEPFVFAQNKEKDSKKTYALTMKYFIIFALLAFLIVMGYLDILKRLIIAPSYWEGLNVVPIVMLAGLLLGIYFNLSLWYKLIDKTIYGMWFSLIGCSVLVLVNVLFIPHFSYMACAWGGVAGYGVAVVLSYVVGQKHYYIDYPLKSITGYVLMAAFFFFLMRLLPLSWPWYLRIGLNTVLIFLFIAHILYHDFPVNRLPYVGKFLSNKRGV